MSRPPARRLKVSFVCGGLPVDITHLEALATDVDLVVHRSNWLPSVAAIPSAPPGMSVVDHRPLWRSGRGHLTFFYPDLPQALDHDRPDVVHVVSEPWGLLAVQSARWAGRRPHVRLVVHGCDTQWHHGGLVKQWVRRRLLVQTLPRTAGWAAESDKAIAVARENGLPPTSRSARIHTNPRDARLFRPPDAEARLRARSALGVGRDEFAVGFLGRLVPEKGVELFLDAAASLLGAGHACRFFIAGDGPLRREVERRCFSGIVPLGRLGYPDEVVSFFSALDVLACPSLSTPAWEDQGPRSVLEAMLCGCIPVATPTGALPEMLGEQGVLATAPTAGALADALVTAMGTARHLEDRARIAAWARERWSSTAVADQLLDLWHVGMPDNTFQRFGSS